MRIVGWMMVMVGAVAFCYSFLWYEFVASLVVAIVGTLLIAEKEKEPKP